MTSEAPTLAQYVNDRPYAASSLLAVALHDAFSTALGVAPSSWERALTRLLSPRLNTFPTPVPATAADPTSVTMATAAPSTTPLKNVGVLFNRMRMIPLCRASVQTTRIEDAHPASPVRLGDHRAEAKALGPLSRLSGIADSHDRRCEIRDVGRVRFRAEESRS